MELPSMTHQTLFSFIIGMKNVPMLLHEVREDIHCASSDVFCTEIHWSFTVAASCGLAAMLCGLSF
jgi:hypothetical protein